MENIDYKPSNLENVANIPEPATEEDIMSLSTIIGAEPIELQNLKETKDYNGKKIFVYDNTATGNPSFIYADVLNTLYYSIQNLTNKTLIDKVIITQSQYDRLLTKNPSTLYVIIENNIIIKAYLGDALFLNGGDSGLDSGELWSILSSSGTQQINASHLSDALAPFITYVAASTSFVKLSDPRLTDSRNAKDVYNWAKAPNKPSYNYAEITNKPTTFTPTSHTHSEYLPLTGGVLTGSITAPSFIKSGGTSTQFLKADGSVDSTNYLSSSNLDGRYLPLTGGVMTGKLTIPSGPVSNNSTDGTGINYDSGGGTLRNAFFIADNKVSIGNSRFDTVIYGNSVRVSTGGSLGKSYPLQPSEWVKDEAVYEAIQDLAKPYETFYKNIIIFKNAPIGEIVNYTVNIKGKRFNSTSLNDYDIVDITIMFYSEPSEANIFKGKALSRGCSFNEITISRYFTEDEEGKSISVPLIWFEGNHSKFDISVDVRGKGAYSTYIRNVPIKTASVYTKPVNGFIIPIKQVLFTD